MSLGYTRMSPRYKGKDEHIATRRCSAHFAEGAGIAVADKGTSPKLRDNVCKDSGGGDSKYSNGAAKPGGEDGAEGDIKEDQEKD